MKLKNSDNNTQVFNRLCVGTQNALTDFLLAQKKMAELKPPSLVVTNRNAAINPQDQTEVPRPCHAFSIFFFQITERCPMKSTRFFWTDDLLELWPSLQKDNDHPHRRHSLQLVKPYFIKKYLYFPQNYKFLPLQCKNYLLLQLQ